jgi:hypothetical protein
MPGMNRLSESFGRCASKMVIKSSELNRINIKIISFANKTTSYWKTSTQVHLHAEEKLIGTEETEIQCGIFQGDSLSPVLFCISLIPLTKQLKKLTEDIKKTQQR